MPHIPDSWNIFRKKPSFVQNKIKQMWKELVTEILERSHVPGDAPWTGGIIIYTLHFPTNRRRDIENYLTVPKFFTDALVSFGLFPDDNWERIYPLVFFGENSPHNAFVDVAIYPMDHPHDHVQEWVHQHLMEEVPHA